MYTIRDLNDYECMHTGCCNVDDPNNVMCNTNAFGEPANLVCVDELNPGNYGACFSENEVVMNMSLNSDWPLDVCSVFGRADKCHVDYPVDACPSDVCKMEKCDNPQDSFVCYQADRMGNAVGPGESWGCSKNKPQKEVACSSRYGDKLCDLSKCNQPQPTDDCNGRGDPLYIGNQFMGCACYPGEGYVGYQCDECAGGHACIDDNGDRVENSEECLPPNNCEYVGRCNNRGTPLGQNGPCSCHSFPGRYSGESCQICENGICVNPRTQARGDPNNCLYPYVCN